VQQIEAKKATTVMAELENRVLRDYALLQALGITSSRISPAVEANNFMRSPTLITFMKRGQFVKQRSDNLNMHLL